MSFLSRSVFRATRTSRLAVEASTRRTFITSPTLRQQQYNPSSESRLSHTDFYRTHGRAFFKSITLAFFSYQVFYWYWTLLEAESVKDEKTGVIKQLEGEVKLLGEGRGSHMQGKRLLEEKTGK